MPRGYILPFVDSSGSPVAPGASDVDSVFGRTGAVGAQTDDYTWLQIDKTTSDIADITTKSHTSLTDIGTNTHAQIDTAVSASTSHIANTSNPHSVTAAQASAVALTGNETVAGLKTFSTLPQSSVVPSAGDDLVNKTYVDSFSQGVVYKDAVRVATTAAGTLASDFENGDTVDDVTLATNDRILIKNQASSIENGIYVVQATGAPTRATDYNQDAEVVAGTTALVLEGTVNGNTLWAQNATDPVVDTDALTFVKISQVTVPGSDTQVIYNDGGSSAGDSTFTFNKTTKTLTVDNLNVSKMALFDEEVDNGNSSTADTIDFDEGNKQKSTLTDNCTFTFDAPATPTNLILKLIQDGTGGRTVTWPAAVLWPEGTAPTLSTGAGAVDIITFYWDGTNYYGGSLLNYS